MVDGALEWWSLAGVDADFVEEPCDWLEVPADVAKPEVAPPPAPRRQTAHQRAVSRTSDATFGGPADAWPKTFEDFAQFWASEPSLDGNLTRPRIAARGPVGAKLMTLVAMPEENDTERLLSGREGALLSSFLSAASLDEDAVRIASILPCRTVAPDWSRAGEDGVAEFTRHHVALARPQRLLVFGKGLKPPLGLADGEAALALGDLTVPVIFAPRLDRLLRQPGQRKQFWNQWLEWTAE